MAVRDSFVTVANGDQLDDGYFNGIPEVKWMDVLHDNTLNDEEFTGIIAHSSTVLSVLSAVGRIYVSIDSGVSWTLKSTVLDTSSFLRACRADRTHGVGIETGATTQEVIFTDTSGSTWSAATSLAFGTQIYDVAFSTAALIVVGGDDAAGSDHIVFSGDDGATWTNATTSPSAAVYCVDMFDANTGYAVDSAGNIWKTINGGVDWTDTTHNNSNPLSGMSIHAVSATKCLIASPGNTNTLFIYDNTAGTSTRVMYFVGNTTTCLGIYKSTSGEYITGFTSSSARDNTYIFKSANVGVNWKTLAPFNHSPAKTITHIYKCGLASVPTNNAIVFATRTPIIKINEAF